METVLTRIVTCHRQWAWIAPWLDDDRLFGPGLAWRIVNDDPADPPPPEVAAALARRGIVLDQPAFNLGRSAARNRGAAAAASPWIEFVDGDDRPWPIDLGELTAAGQGAGLILFPVREHRPSQPPSQPPESLPWDSATRTYWDFLFPDWRPVDPRPAGTLWDRRSFLRLHGFDARYEPSEDLHLLWKASVAGVPVAHLVRPKQSYLLHAAAHFRHQPDYRGSFAFLRWLANQTTGRRQLQVRLLLGRQALMVAGQAGRDLWRLRREVALFLRWKLDGRFRTFNH